MGAGERRKRDRAPLRAPWLVAILALLLLGACDAIGDTLSGAATDERAEELAERVAKQARDQYLDGLRRVLDGTDRPSAEARLLRAVEAPDGVEEVKVNRDQQKSGSRDGFRTLSVSRSVVVVPEVGGPFCAVVGIDSDGDYRGVPAEGDIEDRCRNATHQYTDVQDPLIGGWAGPQR